jgi:hypothetical protein
MLREGLNEYEEDVVKWGANSLYGGGTDTVRNTHPLGSGVFLINILDIRLQPP